MGAFRKVASLARLPAGSSLSIEVDGRALALFNVDGTVYALDAECTHAGAPLCEGEVAGTRLTCPWHGATFDLVSGRALSRPASLDLASYAVRIEGDDVLIDPDAGGGR
jgi:nitrite reductase/ring-hydroxylating ferredoxin subunit